MKTMAQLSFKLLIVTALFPFATFAQEKISNIIPIRPTQVSPPTYLIEKLREDSIDASDFCTNKMAKFLEMKKTLSTKLASMRKLIDSLSNANPLYTYYIECAPTSSSFFNWEGCFKSNISASDDYVDLYLQIASKIKPEPRKVYRSAEDSLQNIFDKTEFCVQKQKQYDSLSTIYFNKLKYYNNEIYWLEKTTTDCHCFQLKETKCIHFDFESCYRSSDNPSGIIEFPTEFEIERCCSGFNTFNFEDIQHSPYHTPY